jgi:hypothetical protein
MPGPVAEPSPDALAEASERPVVAIVGGTAAGPPGADPGVGSGGSDGLEAAASALAATGLTGHSKVGLGAAATLVVSTGAVTMAMAFGLFGRRRRNGEQRETDEVLAAAAATGVGIVLTDLKSLAVATAPGVGAAETGAEGPSDVEIEPGSNEALMPRWRRPSLIQARKADPIRDTVPAAALTFDQGLVGPLDGRERRVIRYRVVRLLDAPDELRGVEIGYLDQGDEVELVEQYGAYWLVLSPDGQQGWLHKMVLGGAVGDEPRKDGPVATMPTVPETWTMGDAEDDDHDVFDAYLASRRIREG